jgi:glycine/serine hydroxymethyltransferase
MREPEMEVIADLIMTALANPEDEATKAKIRSRVKELCDAFPVYGGAD